MEIEENKDIGKLYKALLFYSKIGATKIKLSKVVDDRATELLNKYNIKYKDGLHIAYCELEKIEYLITTDRQLINASGRADLKVKIINQIDFTGEVT